uniref:Regulator of G protein signaling 9a n=1 Tax=Paramormyrops kingsleyae TaxID=1676925 RepID=A0A3B3QJ61_9TELE
MTIRTLHDYAQHYRPRMACLKKVVVLMYFIDGVKSQEQKLVITTIPHATTGQIATLAAQAIGTMMVAFGYIYPLQNHRKLHLRVDSSLYRYQTPYFWPVQHWPAEDADYAIYLAKRNIRKKGVLDLHEQENYNRLHKWLNHKWDFIMAQGKEQYRLSRKRKKADRVVLDCQERAHWVVHRPPPGTVSAMDYGLDRLVDPNMEEVTGELGGGPGDMVRFSGIYKNHDPFLAPGLPSNPWLTDDITYWEHNLPRVEVPTSMRVERWTFSFMDLLSDPCGRADFRLFLKKEFSGENLAFWEACEDLKWGSAKAMREKAEHIYNTFLAPGAPRWINIDGRTMDVTVRGLLHPHRYVLDAAQTHIFLLMKKDTFGRYMKSPVFKETQKRAFSPEEHKFTKAQLDQNARNRKPGIHPIILHQRAQEEKAKLAASGPVDIKQVMSKLDRRNNLKN